MNQASREIAANIAWTTAQSLYDAATALFFARPSAQARLAVSDACLAVQCAYDVQRMADETTNEEFERLVALATYKAEDAGITIKRIEDARREGVTNV